MAFGIADLQPEKEPFELEDGEIIYFVSLAEFDARQKAEFKRAKNELEMAEKRFERARDDAGREEAVMLQKEISQKLVRVILPDLPKADLDGLTMGQMDMVLNHWTKLNEGQQGN